MAYPIPDAALDDRLGFVGTAGSGKTYNSGSGVERVLASGGRVVIPDPLGVWWGLGLNGDGNRPSPWRERGRLVIFGGEHGDLPLNEHHGALVGETVAGMAESAILDLSGFGTKASERRFMLAFLTAFYRHASGDPVHLIFDEADMWAPQRLLDKDGEAAKLLGMMETVVRRGRIKGFLPWLITQRPAVLSKDVLSQVDGLVAFKLTSSQDRAALGAWIEGQADVGQGKEILASLPGLQRGTGVVWVPGRGILETTAFPLKATFDSSRTPKRGERREKRDLKPVDLGKLQEKMAAVVEEAKANDPKVLKAEVARLTRELAAAQKGTAPPWPDQREEVAALAAELTECSAAMERLTASATKLKRRQDAALAALAGEPVTIAPLPTPRAPQARPVPLPVPPPVQRQPAPVRGRVQSEGVDGPQQRILNALAWWRALGFNEATNEQTAFIAEYSPKSTSYQKARGALKSSSLIDYPSAGVLALTADGAEKAQEPDALPSAEELRQRVLGRLDGPQRRILATLIDAYPGELYNNDCANRSDYSPLSTSYQKARGSLRTLKAITYPSSGVLRAADWLFP